MDNTSDVLLPSGFLTVDVVGKFYLILTPSI